LKNEAVVDLGFLCSNEVEEFASFKETADSLAHRGPPCPPSSAPPNISSLPKPSAAPPSAIAPKLKGTRSAPPTTSSAPESEKRECSSKLRFKSSGSGQVFVGKVSGERTHQSQAKHGIIMREEVDNLRKSSKKVFAEVSEASVVSTSPSYRYLLFVILGLTCN
jgi:hypothetical protein